MNVLDKSKDFWLATGLSLLAALVFYFTTKPTMEHFDYTGRIALALLRGHLGLDRHPGSWLSEMVSSQGCAFSSFFDSPVSKLNQLVDGFSSRSFRFLGPGHGAIWDLPARGKLPSALPYWER